MPPIVGVAGASARAAVHSLARAGYAAWACDLFADRDLKQVAPCTVCPIDSFPDALPAFAEQFPPGGALHRHWRTTRGVAELAAARIWATRRVLRKSPRSYLQRARCARAALVPDGERARVRPVAAKAAAFVRRPRIRFATGERLAPLLQEFIDGTPMSAVYVNSAVRVTEQLIGEPWLHAAVRVLREHRPARGSR